MNDQQREWWRRRAQLERHLDGLDIGRQTIEVIEYAETLAQKMQSHQDGEGASLEDIYVAKAAFESQLISLEVTLDEADCG